MSEHDSRPCPCSDFFQSARTIGWIELLFATPVVLWAGWPFFERGWASIVNRSLNMFTLIALGIGTAYVYSVVAILFPGIFPPSFRDMNGAVPIYFEAAAMITALVLLGQVLELRRAAGRRSPFARCSILRRKPRALFDADGTEMRRPVEHIAVGDMLRVRPGEKVPVDGVVTGRIKLRGRIADYRRADSRGKNRGRPRDRRHRQRHRHFRDARRARGQRNAARADRAHGQRSAAQPRADPAARRSRRVAILSRRCC